ncbi:MAG: InlB B-repeat-containing protein [Anaeroplasmataceae bacterium]|nr:InlB B-repeat-containing protein [Anaeroplasmataceae bacterium]
MKVKKIFFSFVFMFILSFCLISCKQKNDSFDIVFQISENDIYKTINTQAGKIDKPDDPQKDGYVFVGWSTDIEGTHVFNFEKDYVSSKITLYAKWEKILTCAEATQLCAEPGYNSKKRLYVRGTILQISNPTYGEMTIEDETGSLYVYGTYSSDGVKRYSELEEKPYAGDEVLLYGILENFNGSAELKSAWIKDFVHHEEVFNEADYTQMSIDAAREIKTGEKVIISGVVARITYANGRIPSGFYLVDETNSIYVYDSQIAPRVEIGNKIKIAASKDFWILDTEMENASKFGYEGCCQVTKVHLLSNDEGKNDFDKSWIKASTVKKIMNTPVTENITTTVFKVNALVKKAEGTGFINYYFNDIDGITGSYTYTQCNGGDFAWLDEFDGKICTVYLSAINAKSSASGCSWRFIPIEVKDEGYTFDSKNACEFAIEYFGVDQFLTSYMSDPSLELITTVSSSLLGLTDIRLSYISSDPSKIAFVEENNKLIMHALSEGKVTITIKASYMSYEFSKDIEVVYSAVEIPNTITVKEAIDSDALTDGGTDVIVRGIVGPSLVNRDGFYLIDSTGVIAITTSKDVLAKVNLGNEVILQGKRTLFGHEGNYYGQSVILDCNLIVNLYGSNEYSRETFDDTKTLEDLLSMSTAEDHTTQVYVLDVTIEVVEQDRFSNIYLVSTTDAEKKMQLYTSSASQYNWLKKYAGETIRIELALCNWNKKNPFKGCVLSVENADGVFEYNILNFPK